MQNKEENSNKIHCIFKEDAKEFKEVLKDAFIDFVKEKENKREVFEKNDKNS